ncbi:riboflavin synthase [Peptoniphilus raoultii]|uniref:riboflavin synthase n=1 Tax=Peptoniphilus raoultii TaxID=1776387 RepID=UPI0009F2F30B|nr:riboflavin synthase [Peptoniphilus raoultii]
MINIFTGIIEEVGKIASISKEKNIYKIKVSCKAVLEKTKVGDSIATNGVCLTVTDFGEDFYEADLMKETLNASSFKSAKAGDLVNLERAMTLDKRLDGHIVQGHIDSLGTIKEITNANNFVEYKIKADTETLKQMVYKGSVALDGISLTISEVSRDYFKVSIIPTTIKSTNLWERKMGDPINIETDIIGKYIYKFFNDKNSKDPKINMNFLRENGFY